MDQNIKFQQNIATLPIAILIAKSRPWIQRLFRCWHRCCLVRHFGDVRGVVFLVRFLARLGRIVCTRSDFLGVMLLFLLYLLVVRYVAGVGHGNLFRLSKPASFLKDNNPNVGQTNFRVRTRALYCRTSCWSAPQRPKRVTQSFKLPSSDASRNSSLSNSGKWR